MAKPKRYSWDACSWIATIIQEQVPLPGGDTEDRASLCNHVLEQARSRKVEIATSGLSLAEVCKRDDVKSTEGDTIADFFRHEYVVLVPVDRQVGTLARELMQAGHAGLKPPDAVHIATAIVADADELHTFDTKLLNLDGMLTKPSGHPLRICKPPTPPQASMGLFGPVS